MYRSLAVVSVAILAISFVHGESRINVIEANDVESVLYGLTGRIVNGTKAALRQFPYQVSLRRSYNSRHFCGGSLISERHVLTAGHCMFLNGARIQPWTIMVVAGQLELEGQTSTGQRKGVDSIILHPEFNQTTLQNDAAILVLTVPFTITPEVKVAPLAGNSPVVNTVCQVSGWGYPAENYPEVSDYLMYVDIPIIKRERCKELLVNVTELPPGMFCAGYEEGQRDACQGDSGGGMVCNGILTGVVSGGEGCARPGLPGVYTDVFFFMDWIIEKTNIKIPAIRSDDADHAPTSASSGADRVRAAALLPLFRLFV